MPNKINEIKWQLRPRLMKLYSEAKIVRQLDTVAQAWSLSTETLRQEDTLKPAWATE